MTKVQEMRVRVAEAERAKLNRKMAKTEKYINRLIEDKIPKAADKGKSSIKVKVPVSVRPFTINRYLHSEGFAVEVLHIGLFRVLVKISWE